MKGEKSRRVREILLDPLTCDQSYCAIARFVDMDPSNVMRVHRDLVARGLVPDRPALPSRGRSKAMPKPYSKSEHARRLMLDPGCRTLSIADVARAVGLNYRDCKRLHAALVAEGRLEAKHPHNRKPRRTTP